jgi:hypothetical protein
VLAAAVPSTGAAGACALAKRTTTVRATGDDQVIELLQIDVTGSGPAVEVSGFKRVTVRNVAITFGPGNQGISFGGADGLTIVNVSLTLVGAPPSPGAGPHPLPSSGAVAIGGSGSQGVRVDRVRAEGASSGVYLINCPGAYLSNIEGHNLPWASTVI